MCRLIELIVRSGLVTACRFASCPTRRSPVFVNATTDGVVLLPSAFAITVGAEPSITATTEFVVPRSMPTTFAIEKFSISEHVDQPEGLAAYRDSRTVLGRLYPKRTRVVTFPMTVNMAPWLRKKPPGGCRRAC